MAQRRLYERIAEALSGEIVAGRHPVGKKLPSERELSARFEVSRPTIREALIALEVDGLVEVVTGSGVFVRSDKRKRGLPAKRDVGPFELLEARAHIEGEAAALAAQHIDDDEVMALEALVAEMETENGRDVVMSEDADRRFHMAIAAATKNSAMEQAVEALWEARNQSLQNVRFLEKVRAEGIKPRIDEHMAVMTALKNRDPNAARAAMRTHLRGVADMVFQATEAEAVERARAEVASQRRRFQLGE
ncbi:FadR/GntR family transcriptional regulator [Aurantiacibacter gangjinensis]|uniref:GntR family transcriptional regulator n=1 Tax=Aurantiacibacter gangjinensis TaxID=502682 RepID=A0A0G9MRM2_9SPHN|nr:FadR/GntR family transcriptional regulator [Aurantiacibacter gangjinensis]APE26897.1 Transcriptional regulator, GntR family [Aurantiacibacter gangjinensis]KLE33360.1 GntR family transcriptional regulator [Aurantiacibacter gangjinensis]